MHLYAPPEAQESQELAMLQEVLATESRFAPPPIVRGLVLDGPERLRPMLRMPPLLAKRRASEVRPCPTTTRELCF